MKNKSGPKILIVEDNKDATEALFLTLQKWCSVIDIHNDAMQTVAGFKAGTYDLVLLDYMLPKMNGFELFKIIKQIDPDVKICLMTACEIMASDASRREFEQLSPSLTEEHILRKPFDRKQLFSKIWQILSGRDISVAGAAEREQDLKIFDP